MPTVTGKHFATTIALCLEKRWMIVMTCGTCKRRVMWGRVKLESLPPTATIGDLAGRVVSDCCGSREGVIYTQQAHEHWEQRNA